MGDSLTNPTQLRAPEIIAAKVVEDAIAGTKSSAEAHNGNEDPCEIAERDAVDALLPAEPAARRL